MANGWRSPSLWKTLFLSGLTSVGTAWKSFADPLAVAIGREIIRMQ